MRLDAHLSAPPVIPIPDEDDDLHEAPPDIEMPLSTAVEDAFAHLERAIDNMHADHPTRPGFDPLFYLALSNLPLTYPWPILTVDLKSFLPLMDRHVMTHLVAGRSAVNPQYQHPAPVLASFFTDLAHTIAHHLLAPLNSQYMRPNLPPRIFTSEFWHAHFNYAALRTDPSLAAVGSMDGLAGDQLCQWNSVAPDSILPATHLTLFLPPPLGAFVLANHQSHEDFKSTPASATQATPIFSVQQHLQFPLPQVFANQQEHLSLARQSAVEGYLSPETIPFLGHSNQHLTYKKVRWALHFPLPPPTKDPSARRFSSTPAFRQGPRSNEALEGAIRVAAPFSYNSEASVYLTDSHFLKLPDFDPYLGSLHRNVNPAPPDAATCAWLRSGALRLSQRDEGDKSSIPLGLLAFFGSDISHTHVTELIRTHSTTSQDAINRMRAEHRAGRTAFKMPRKPHPKQALLEQAAQAKGAKAPPTPPPPHIAPLPEGFAIEAPVPSPRTTQPASARAKASKRPAPEGASSSSRQASPPPSDTQPDPPTFWDFGPPLTMFSGDPDRPPIGAHPHPYRRTSSSTAGKDTGKGKGTPTLTYADIANKGKKGGKGGKGPKGHKGHKGHKGDKGGKGDKGHKGDTPVLQGGKDTPKGGKK